MAHRSEAVEDFDAAEGSGARGAAGCPSQEVDEPEESQAWEDKVTELGARAFTLHHLLDFCKALGTATVMPHFDATKSKTNDVVRQAIIPMSRRRGTWGTLRRGLGADLAEGAALATCMQDGEPLRAMRMVTHNWDNLFAHLVAAVIADALGERKFQDVLDVMGHQGGLELLKEEVARRGADKVTYWICAVSINQHASICGGFGPEPEQGTPQFQAFDAKRRDSVTGAIYPLCSCSTEKHFNNHRDACELNKFDSMMRSLSRSAAAGGFRQIIALDEQLDLFSRAWCVAELVEGRRLRLDQVLIIRDASCLPKSKAEALKKVRVQECQASRPEDVKEILDKIDDKDEFNSELQELLFAGHGSLVSDLQKHLKGSAEHGDLAALALDALF